MCLCALFVICCVALYVLSECLLVCVCVVVEMRKCVLLMIPCVMLYGVCLFSCLCLCVMCLNVRVCEV